MDTPTIGALLQEAATLLGVGMSVVFIFLTILVFSVKLMTKICLSFPEAEEPASRSSRPQAHATTQRDQEGLEAIKAAVSAYRAGNTNT